MAMRQILVDDWRRRQALRRGGGAAEVLLDDGVEIAAPVPGADVLAVDEALRALEAQSPRLARLVECRFFAGYSEAETAQALGVSVATVQRDWAKARAWLHRALG
jgi:RNA polymerase sigma factor (TIGR02999 family)